jgi:hypothetical protein
MAITRFTRLAAPALRIHRAVRASSFATVHGNDPEVSAPPPPRLFLPLPSDESKSSAGLFERRRITALTAATRQGEVAKPVGYARHQRAAQEPCTGLEREARGTSVTIVRERDRAHDSLTRRPTSRSVRAGAMALDGICCRDADDIGAGC